MIVSVVSWRTTVREAALPGCHVRGLPRLSAGTDLDRLRQPAVAHPAPSRRAADSAEQRLDLAPAQEPFRSVRHQVVRFRASSFVKRPDGYRIAS